MKNKRKTLKEFLFENETDTLQTIPNVTPAQTTQPMDISLDQKVDRFLIQYERESVPSAEMYGNDAGLNQGITAKAQSPMVGTFAEGRKIKTRKGLSRLLFEADEDPAGDLDTGDAGIGDLGGGGDTGDSGGGDSAPEVKVASPVINLDSFSERVARLINNNEALLDPRTVILNRTYVYLAKNYDERVANEMLVLMETKFNISRKTDREKTDDLVGMGPFSAAAIDSSGGGGGG
jgi:hypothetical protein